MAEAEVEERCVTKQGITLNVRAVIAFKVGNDSESVVNAGQRFLSDQNQMSVLTGRIFAGHLRSIIGSMTVEEIVTERQKLATEVLDGSKEEMIKIGLTVDALQIQSIDDGDRPIVANMAAPHNAAIQRQAADLPVTGPPAIGRGRAGVAAPPGRVRPADRGRPGAVQGRGRQGAGRRVPGRTAPRRPRRSARCCRRRPSWPSATPSCANSNWWPRSSSRLRPKPSAFACWPRPTPSESESRPKLRPRTTGSPSTGCSSTSCR